MNTDKHFEFDKEMSRKVKAELLAQGVKSYPANCSDCSGTGSVYGSKCQNCNGKGSYELAI